MTYPNAFKGVKNIYASMIISLIAAVCSILMTALMFSRGFSSLSTVYAFAVIVMILGLLALVLELVGICQAVRDEPAFIKARTAAIVALILAFIGALSADGSLLETLTDLAQQIASLCCTVYIVKGVMELAGKLNRPDMVVQGRKLCKLITIVFCAGIVLRLLDAMIPASKAGLAFVLVLAIATLVAAIVELVLFLSYLGKAVKMLSGDPSPSAQF